MGAYICKSLIYYIRVMDNVLLPISIVNLTNFPPTKLSCYTVYVTGFWKTDRNVTLGLFHFIGPANAYTHTLHIRNGTRGGRYMEGMVVKFTSWMGRRLLRHSSVFGLMTGSSGTHD